MNKYLLTSLLILLCLPVFSTKKALLVGVGNYPANSGWHTISSVNDIHILEGILSGDFVVETLIDQQATKKGINEAFRRLTLECSKGDTVLIHFSCHGQQMLSAQSEEPDGLDEALVPYDAKSKKSPDYSGEKHLLDNDLSVLLTSIRKRLGVHGLLVVTLDACYSDSNHKGEKDSNNVVFRGGADIFGSNEISEDSLITVKKKQLIKDESSIDSIPDGSNIIMLSACESFQKNREIRIDGHGYGCLSYSMFKAFESCSLKDVSVWLDEVYNQMNEYAYTQSPQVRNTIGYIPPKSREIVPPDDSGYTDKDSNVLLQLTIGVASLLTLALIIWIWKKRIKK
jgi:hypothetical protein